MGIWWFWDPLNPLRAYVLRNDGRVDEWWPAGGVGHAIGEVNTLYGPTSGFDSHIQGRRHMCHPSADGQFYVSGCRRTSDGHWGGRRRNLLTGALGPFFEHPDGPTVGSDFTAQGTSFTGLYTRFQRNGNRWWVYNAATGEEVADTLDVDTDGISHTDFTIVNGREYIIGMRSTPTGFRGLDILTNTYKVWGTFPGANPQHTGTRNIADLFQTHGAAGGGTSGVRYAIWSRSGGSGGHPPAILGVRLGPNDQDVVRYICNHRSVRTTNANEVHAQQTGDGRKIVFPSNWHGGGVATDGDVHPYVVLIPDAWWSTNNDGSAV